jgi:hypothetical protein
MSDVDDRLTAALHADAPPTHDAMFRVEVLVRLERARFRRRVMLTMAVVVAAAVLVAVNAQAIGAWMAMDVRRVGIVAMGAMAAMFALLPGVQGEAFQGARVVVRALDRWLYQ